MSKETKLRSDTPPFGMVDAPKTLTARDHLAKVLRWAGTNNGGCGEAWRDYQAAEAFLAGPEEVGEKLAARELLEKANAVIDSFIRGGNPGDFAIQCTLEIDAHLSAPDEAVNRRWEAEEFAALKNLQDVMAENGGPAYIMGLAATILFHLKNMDSAKEITRLAKDLANEKGQHQITQEYRKQFDGHADRMRAEADAALAEVAVLRYELNRLTVQRNEAQSDLAYAKSFYDDAAVQKLAEDLASITKERDEWKQRYAAETTDHAKDAQAFNETLAGDIKERDAALAVAESTNGELQRLRQTHVGCEIECERLREQLAALAMPAQAPPSTLPNQSGDRTMTTSSLTFSDFRKANVSRCLGWHPQGIKSWSSSDWLTAVAGELGELASLIKMRNRERDGLPGNKFSPTDKRVADEIADVVTYLDLLAESLGWTLARLRPRSSTRCRFDSASPTVSKPGPRR